MSDAQDADEVTRQLRLLRAQRNAIQPSERLRPVDGEPDAEEYDAAIDVDDRQSYDVVQRPINAPKEVYRDIPIDEDRDPFAETRTTTIAQREDAYHARRHHRRLSPSRADAFAQQDAAPEVRTYRDVMIESTLDREREQVQRKILAKPKEVIVDVEKRRQWEAPGPTPSEWEEPSTSTTPRGRRWDVTPSSQSDTEATPTSKRQKWDVHQTEDTPSRSRWDATPTSLSGQATPTTVRGGYGLETPRIAAGSTIPMTPEHLMQMRVDRELGARNRPLSDVELDALLPSEGYVILEPPDSYVPIRTPARKLLATPTPYTASGAGGFTLAEPMLPVIDATLGVELGGDLPLLKPEDFQHFASLVHPSKPETELTIPEIMERKVMRLLLKIKNGTPQMRKSAMRQMTERARDFGPGLLFDKLLPLLMSPALEDQERHLLVKVIDRILFKLEDLVRPYVHKILVVTEPLLIDEDYYTRVEGREIISNLSKAAGLAAMIAAMRPDIDHPDEYVRNTTARALSVVASALGVPALLPFIRAVCRSRKAWEARHTGIKIVQQIAIQLGCGVLPHLRALVECVAEGLVDDLAKVRTIAALSIAALAEAATPYGIDAFEAVLKPLWKGIRMYSHRALAAFLKAIGYIIPLMDAELAAHYTRDMMLILIREFDTPDEDMKKIVLKVVRQIIGTEGVTPAYLRTDMLPPFFSAFWHRRMAMDRRSASLLVDTTADLGARVGASDIVLPLVMHLKDESEPFRRMVAQVLHRVIVANGAADLDDRLVEQLVDGLLWAFQEQSMDDDPVMVLAFGAILRALSIRAKPYIQQIASTVLWRLNNKSAKVRQQAADLVAQIASVMVHCHEEALLEQLSAVLYEYLGEEYPDVLGSILGGLKGIVAVIGMHRMRPPISELLPRLTPILKNRHEKVQEHCIDLVGRIAERGAESVSAREWMRICFELLDMLKAHKRSIRRAAVGTFGYIAKAIGPQDVLTTLLNNLKVQERQNRVCTTVAIAIVAETCAPFTVLPALMNEYRVPELNVQNGVLKSLAFLFEYIGEMGRDYMYAVTPLLEDALVDRDLVHRQTAAAAVRHVALGVVGLGCEDALVHLLNVLWPNIFETSPHVIQAVMDALDGLRVALGPGRLFGYVCQGLFHPARRIRQTFWKLYNALYLGHQDAMVAYYPRLDRLDGGKYRRHEMDVLL